MKEPLPDEMKKLFPGLGKEYKTFTKEMLLQTYLDGIQHLNDKMKKLNLKHKPNEN